MPTTPITPIYTIVCPFCHTYTLHLCGYQLLFTSPTAKQSRTDFSHVLEDAVQPFKLQHNQQIPVLQYPHAHFLQSTTSYDSSVQFSAVDTYASYLKSVYTREKQPLYKWMKVKPKKYIHLTLIKRGTLQNKRLINL